MNINLPGRVIKDQAVTAAWANSIREAIARLARNDIAQSRLPRDQRGQIPFRVSGVTLNTDEEFTVAVYPGYVVGSNAAVGADPVFAYFMPEIDGIPLDAEETPELEVEKDKTVYLKVTTDNKDIIQTVEIVLDDPDKAGLHHHPPPNATIGEYYYPLADIEEVEIPDPPEGQPSSRLVVTNRRQLPSPFVHRQLLIELRNVGVDPGRPIYKENVGDIYDIRSLEQLEGGVPCLRPLDEAVPPLLDENGDPVLDPETGEPVEPGQPAEEEGDTLQFKAFRVETGVPAEFDEQREINELQFTGATGAVDNAAIKITTVKGLVTLLAPGDGLDDGKDLDLTVVPLDYALGGGDEMIFVGTGSATVHYWRDGIYVGTDDPEDGGGKPAGLVEQMVTLMRLTS